VAAEGGSSKLLFSSSHFLNPSTSSDSSGSGNISTQSIGSKFFLLMALCVFFISSMSPCLSPRATLCAFNLIRARSNVITS